jgi:repressor LexA
MAGVEGSTSAEGDAVTDLTDRQRQVLDYLRACIASRGFSPSVREIGRALGMSSSGTVAQHLERLEAKGYIRRHGSRAIEILPEAR